MHNPKVHYSSWLGSNSRGNISRGAVYFKHPVALMVALTTHFCSECPLQTFSKQSSPCYESSVNQRLNTKAYQWQPSQPRISIFASFLLLCLLYGSSASISCLTWLYILSRVTDGSLHESFTKNLKIFCKSAGGFVNYRSDICPLWRKELAKNISRILLERWWQQMSKHSPLILMSPGSKRSPQVSNGCASVSGISAFLAI